MCPQRGRSLSLRSTSGQRSVVVALLTAAAAAIWRATMDDLEQYTKMFEFVEGRVRAGACLENLLLLHTALTPFRSFALVRGAALFLSFSLVLLGSLFVLTGIKTAYQLNVEVPGRAKSTLEASSPGLLLIAVGAALMAASIYRHATPTFQPAVCARAPAHDGRERLKDTLNPPLGGEESAQ